MNHIADEEAYSADEDEWTPDRIHSIQQKINSLGNGSKNGLPFYTKTLLVNNRAIKFIVDTGSPITLIPKSKFNNITTMKPVTTDYRDVNDNKIKFEGKTTANIRIDGKKRQLELLVTTKQTHPLLGLDWMEKLGITLNTDNNTQTIKHITDKPNQINCNSEREITALKSKFHKLFSTNHTVKNVEVYIQLKDDAKLIQQKGRPIPIHLQQAVGKEIEKLKQAGTGPSRRHIQGSKIAKRLPSVKYSFTVVETRKFFEIFFF